MDQVPGAGGRTRRALPLLDRSVPGAAPGGPARGERRDAAEHRRQVLDAARRLFDARGVDAVSMDEIAREAGVGKGTLYRRYAHKGALCEALLDESTRRLQAEVLARVGRGAADGPALAQLDFLLVRLVAHDEEHGALLGAVRDAACGERRGALYGRAPYDWQRLTALALLRRAVAAGECPPLDAEYLADAILAPLDIDLYLFQRQRRGLTPERIVAGLRRLVLDGVRGEGSTRDEARSTKGAGRGGES